jgi:hypothetical protein
MKRVPSSNFSKGEELTEVPDVRTSRKSAPFRVGYPRSCGPIRPVTGRPSLAPTSFTRYSIPLPCGRATTEVGSIGLTQLSMEKNLDRFGWSLYPGGSVVDVVVLVRRRAIRPTYRLVTACQPFWPFRSHEA